MFANSWAAVPRSACSEVVSGRPLDKETERGHGHQRSVELAESSECARDAWSGAPISGRLEVQEDKNLDHLFSGHVAKFLFLDDFHSAAELHGSLFPGGLHDLLPKSVIR